uniref:Uncharacterized protein n=1 Tax=Avena sativa TaxID=4498 RepID=A0ACD6AT79_AVESA
MRTEIIRADNIDLAVEKILVKLGADTASIRKNAIYFDGWDGLGASAVLQAVARRLRISNELATKPMGLEFDEIIHIDCSKWESRRAMQRKIAEQLKLPIRVMDIFDKQDEEDDFNILEEGSRGEIAQVTRAIYKTIQNRRFLVILHNGSNEEIDIFNFGLSLYGYANSKMLWTFQGRFRLDTKMIDNVSLMKKLHHPNILLFMGAVTSPHRLCIVTEYLPRGSLFRLLQRSTTKLDWRRRVHMALDVVSAFLFTSIRK